MSDERLVRYCTLSARAADIAKRWHYYYTELIAVLSGIIPSDVRLVQLGSGSGELLARLSIREKTGIEANASLLEVARKAHPDERFLEDNYWKLHTAERFDYVLISEITDALDEVEVVFREAAKLITTDGRLVVVSRSPVWQPAFRLAQLLFPRTSQGPFNSILRLDDLKNLLYLAGFEVIKSGRGIPAPVYVPGASWLANRILAGLPLFSLFGAVQYVVARPRPLPRAEVSVSIIVAARNEKGNIENILKRIPLFAPHQEIVFIEGNSSDGTWDEILRVQKAYAKTHTITALQQDGRGKWNAVEKGFKEAGGELLMILDADMTTMPEDLPRFYAAYLEGRGDFINGSRLIYPMDEKAMRFLNKLGNLGFAKWLSLIIRHKLTDTLCGTKVFRRADWLRMLALRERYPIHDPFGDFEMLFGAARLNLRIVDLPVHYRERSYGEPQIQRFRDGWRLLTLTLRAWRYFAFVR